MINIMYHKNNNLNSYNVRRVVPRSVMYHFVMNKHADECIIYLYAFLHRIMYEHSLVRSKHIHRNLDTFIQLTDPQNSPNNRWNVPRYRWIGSVLIISIADVLDFSFEHRHELRAFFVNSQLFQI